MSFRKLLSFLREFIDSPTEFEKNRREFYKRQEFRKISLQNSIMQIIISCKTFDHTKSCRHWIEYMLGDPTPSRRRPQVIDLYMYEGLSKAIDLKEKEIKNAPREIPPLPFQAKRIERISKEEGSRRIRIAPMSEVL